MHGKMPVATQKKREAAAKRPLRDIRRFLLLFYKERYHACTASAFWIQRVSLSI